MWKPSQTGSTSPTPTPEPPRAAPPAIAPENPSRLQAGTADQATLGKGLFVKGEITGSESLYIDGKV
ncbi:MAG: polymer-forming cytoskeletal protein, partial [Terracidiphilus sp.]